MAYRISKLSDRINALCHSKDSRLAVLVMHDPMRMYDGVIYDRVANENYSKKIPFECIQFPMDEFDGLSIQYDHRGYPFVYEDNFDATVQDKNIVREPR